MKPIPWTAVAAAALALCGANAPSFAQRQSQVEGQTQTQPITDTPAPIVIETKVDLTTGGPQTPQSDRDARKEAIGALADAKTTCRNEPSKQAQSECLRQAQEEYNEVMGRSSHRRHH